jgi:uncharacterized protein YciI
VREAAYLLADRSGEEKSLASLVARTESYLRATQTQMKNFLILIKYKVPLEIVEQHTAAHREYLKTQYASGRVLMSGPLVPRTAGLLWAQAQTREEVQSMIDSDPFQKNGVANWEVIEFNPVMYADTLNRVFESQKA